MADEDPTRAGLLKINDPGIKTSYANFSHVHINATDLYLYFGIQSADGGVEDVAVGSRIIVTHDSFMRMMEFWSTRYSVLAEIYGNTPRSLRDFDHQRVSEIFAAFINPDQPDSEQEETNAKSIVE